MKKQARKILVGFDFSPQSKRAVDVAISMAAKTSGRVYALTVFEERLGRDSAGNLSVDAEADDREEAQKPSRTPLGEIRRHMEEILRPLCGDRDRLIIDATDGKPYRKLLDAANSVSADLVLVGATGAGRLERWILGSTAERVARRSRLPVLVTRKDQPWPPRHILCAVDFSPASANAAAWAASFSTQWGASLEILYVIPGCDVNELQTLGRLSPAAIDQHISILRTSAERKMATFVSAKPLDEVGCRSAVLHGRPFERIIQRAREWAADLVVMGTVGRDGIAGLLIGNTAERVLRSGPCSVLTVRPPAL